MVHGGPSPWQLGSYFYVVCLSCSLSPLPPAHGLRCCPRSTTEAHWWPAQPTVFAGQDLMGKGTWLGVNKVCAPECLGVGGVPHGQFAKSGGIQPLWGVAFDAISHFAFSV